jgi:hypothetical protein
MGLAATGIALAGSRDAFSRLRCGTPFFRVRNTTTPEKSALEKSTETGVYTGTQNQMSVVNEGSPPRGLFEARRGKCAFWEKGKLKPPRERPRGGGGTYRNRGYGGISPHHRFGKDSI